MQYCARRGGVAYAPANVDGRARSLTRIAGRADADLLAVAQFVMDSGWLADWPRT